MGRHVSVSQPPGHSAFFHFTHYDILPEKDRSHGIGSSLAAGASAVGDFFTTLFGGTRSLERFWRNLGEMPGGRFLPRHEEEMIPRAS